MAARHAPTEGAARPFTTEPSAPARRRDKSRAAARRSISSPPISSPLTPPCPHPPPRLGSGATQGPIMQHPTEASTRQGILLMLLSLLMFTAMDALAKGLVQRYPTPQVVWARFAGQLFLVVLILNIRLGPALRTRTPAPACAPLAHATGRHRVLLRLPHPYRPGRGDGPGRHQPRPHHPRRGPVPRGKTRPPPHRGRHHRDDRRLDHHPPRRRCLHPRRASAPGLRGLLRRLGTSDPQGGHDRKPVDRDVLRRASWHACHQRHDARRLAAHRRRRPVALRRRGHAWAPPRRSA